MTVTLCVERPDDDLWPAGLDPARRAYLEALVGADLSTYVTNAPGSMVLARVGDRVVPLVVGATRRSPGDTSLTSPTQYFAGIPKELIERCPRSLSRGPLSAAVGAWGRLCDGMRLDRVIHVNQWLLTSQPVCPLTAPELRELTTALEARYPGYAILVSHVGEAARPELEGVGYRSLFARTVYVWDPRDGSALGHANTRRDFKLLRKTKLRVEVARDPDAALTARLSELYAKVYVEHYSALNPRYTPAFFDLVIRAGLLQVQLVLDGPRVLGFSSLFSDEAELVSSIVGHDLEEAKELGVYRLGQARLLEVARDAKRPLDMSAGAGKFKSLRGAEPRDEVQAIRADHLSIPRRGLWRALTAANNRWAPGGYEKIGA